MPKKIVKRLKTNSKDRKDCYVCDKYNYITELHHLITMSDINKILLEIKCSKKINFEDYFNSLNEVVEGIYLCPNHHTLYHKLLSKEYVEIILMLSNAERKKYSELFKYVKKKYEVIIDSLRNIELERSIIKQMTKEKIKIETTLNVLYEIQKN